MVKAEVDRKLMFIGKNLNIVCLLARSNRRLKVGQCHVIMRYKTTGCEFLIVMVMELIGTTMSYTYKSSEPTNHYSFKVTYMQ